MVANNVVVTVSADVSKFNSQLAVAKVQMADFAKGQRDAARVVASGSGDMFAAQTNLLRYGEGLRNAALEVKSLEKGLRTVEPAAAGAVHGIGGIVREFAVLGREGFNHNFTKMTGSATILTQRLASLGTATLSSYAGVAALGVGALALAGTLAYVAYEGFEARKAAEGMAEAFALSGRGAGHSADQVRAEVSALADLADVSTKVAQSLIAFDATHAQVDARISNSANQLIPAFAKAFGEKGVEELNKFKTELSAVSNGTTEQAIKKFNELNSTMLGFKPALVQTIEGMIESGDRIGAVTKILADYAAQGGAHIVAVKDQIVATQGELAIAQQRAAALAAEASKNVNPRLLTAIQSEAGLAAAQVTELQHRLQSLQAIAATPISGETLDAAFENSHATMLSLRDSATRAKDAVAQLHREMEQRRAANPNDKEANDYFANQAKVDRDLAHREDPGDFKKPKAPKKVAGESEMTKYENELRESETRIRESTGNWSRSMVAEEEKYWKGKLDAAKKGSKLYGELQTKYDEAHAAAEREKAEQQRQIADNNASTDLTVKKSDINTRKDKADDTFSQSIDSETSKSAIGAAETKRDALKALAKEEAQDEIDAERAKAKAYADDVVKQAEAANQVKVINANLATQLAQIDRAYTSDHQREVDKRKELDKKAADEQAKGWKSANAEILSAESKLVSDMMSRRKTLGQSLIEISRSLVSQEIINDLKYLTEKKLLNMEGLASDQATAKGGLLVHLLTSPQKTAATSTSATTQATATTAQLAAQQSAQTAAATASAATTLATSKAQVAMLAGLAGAGGVASMAAAPFPIDLGAPAFGAQMSALALSMGSFAQGTNIVPNDMIAQIHAGEAIIPKADNTALRSLAERGAAGRDGSSQDGAKGGDTHIHYAPTVNGQMPFKEQLAAHEDNIISIMQRAARRGVRFA